MFVKRLVASLETTTLNAINGIAWFTLKENSYIVTFH